MELDRIAVEKRIRIRATELIQQYPNVVIVESQRGHKPIFCAKDYQNLDSNSIDTVLQIIELIEAELAKKHPHKQTTIDFKTE